MANIDNAFTASEGVSLDDVVGIFQSANDPTVGGEAAPVGSLLLCTNGTVYRKTGTLNTNWVALDNHSGLSGLLNDDHTQYLNNTRGDVRYYTKSQVDALLKEYPIFYHNGNTTQTFSAATTLLFPTVGLSHSNYTYSAGSFTVLSAGTYEIVFDASYTIATNNRTISSTELRVNGTFVSGSRCFGNHGNNVEGQQTTKVTVKLPLNVNDVITIVGSRLSGTANLISVAQGCRVNIRRLQIG
jgi:hypothetical protein